MTHTPGKWELVEQPKFGPGDYEGLNVESLEHNTIICEMAGGLPLWEILSNARLIAAAPELLEACRAAVDEWHDQDSNFDKEEPLYLTLCRAALAKTEEGE